MTKNKLQAAISGAIIASSGALISGVPTIASAEEARLEEITVTARRRNESLMSTPVSVSAFSGDELKRLQVDKIDQIGRSTPNVEFRSHSNASSGNNNAVVYIRGIGQSDFAASTEPGVGIYVDDAYISQAAGAVMSLVDIESVQVLRGPQGTLFGRNTIGGAVLINTVKPNDEFGGSAEITVGEEDLLETSFKVNVPLTDTLFGRFALQTRERDGWVDHPNISGSRGGGSEENWGVRVALRWLASDNLTIDFNTDFTNSKSDGTPGVLVDQTFNSRPDSNTFSGAYNHMLAPALGLPLYDERFIAGDGKYVNYGTGFEQADQDVLGATLNIEWELDAFTLTSVTNYREIESFDLRDEDASPLGPISHVGDELESEQFSQEFKLNGQAWDDKLTWTTGVYYFKDDAININPVEFTLFGLISGAIVEKESSAWFGQVTYDFSDQWSLTLGARYTDENKDFLVNDRIQYINRIWLPFLDPANPPVMAMLPPNAVTLASKGKTEANQNNKDYHANLSYQWTEDLLVYASFSEGFKGGGFVQRIAPGADVTSYDPEFAKVYELGFKWEGESLRLTGAVFYTDYTDLQITVERGIAPVTVNGGDAEIRGAELEFLWLPNDQWRVSGGLGFLDNEYTKLDPDATITKDTELASAPDMQANLSVAYTIPQPVFSGNMTIRLDYSHTNPYYMNAENEPVQEVDKYGLLHATVNWVNDADTLEVSLRGRNLTDEWYLTSPQGGLLDGQNGFVTPTVGQPTEYSLNIAYRF